MNGIKINDQRRVLESTPWPTVLNFAKHGAIKFCEAYGINCSAYKNDNDAVVFVYREVCNDGSVFYRVDDI